MLAMAPVTLPAAPSGFDPYFDDDEEKAPVAEVTPPSAEPKDEAKEEPKEEPKDEPKEEPKEEEPKEEEPKEDASTPSLPLPPPVTAAELAAPHEERGPSSLQTYISENRTPRYMRFNLKGHRVRKSPEFGKESDNVDFQSEGGELFPVASVRPMEQGAAVEIFVQGERRWVYVADARKGDFQFCESDACLTALADSLDFLLSGTGVNMVQAQDCGVSVGPEGLILPAGAAVPDADEPTLLEPVAARAVKQRPKRAPVAVPLAKMSVAPLWEKARGAEGARWTKLLSAALDKNGQGLLAQDKLSDAKVFCPRYAKLSLEQRKEFYIHLFAGMARYESNFSTNLTFDEERYEKRRKPYNIRRGPIKPKAFSMGLFQMSYEGTKGYKPKCFDFQKDRRKDVSDPSLTIYDPKAQMECAVTVLNQWVTRDGGIGYTRDIYDRKLNRGRGGYRFRGGANYWSTLRNTNPATQDLRDSLRRYSACWK